MLLRRWLEETPVFEEMRRRAAVSQELPLRTVCNDGQRSYRNRLNGDELR
jgi:hypothetical protein